MLVREKQTLADLRVKDAPQIHFDPEERPLLVQPGKLVVALPDNHLQYAITWIGLALGLAGVYGVWLLGRLRQSA